MLSRLRSLLAAALRRESFESGVADEIEFHLHSRVDDLVARGLTPAEALARARREFGSTAAYADECREARGLRWLDDLRGDLVYAWRSFRRTPVFAIAAILSLTLGIGANTLVFSVVNALVLKPLPIPDPGRFVFVQNVAGGYVSHSFPNYLDFRDRNVTFDGLIAYRVSPMNVEIRGAAMRAWGYLATGNYFDVLGLRPEIGRFFHPAEDVRPGGSPFAVLSDAFWRAQFGGRASVVGSTIRINGLPYTVLGVAPPAFYGTELFYRPQIWVPITMQAQIEVGNSWLQNRYTFNSWVAGRLRAGVTRAQGESNLNAIAADLARAYPEANDGLRVKLARPGLLGDAFGGPVRAFTVGLLLLAGLVLLAACANLASTLAARGADRRRELAIRLSIGAGRGRIVRQLLTEALALAAAGGVAGGALAFVLARSLSAIRLPVDLPVQFDVHPDPRVFAFATAVTIAAGLLFGLAPARQAARANPSAALKTADGVDAHRPRLPFREALIVAQVSLCVVVVAASLLALRGLRQALTMPIGFDPRGVTVAGYELGLGGYTRQEGEAFQQRVLDAVGRLPGVEQAAFSNSLPLSIDQSSTTTYSADGPVGRPADAIRASRYEVSPGFFGVLRVPILRGRDFDWRDREGAPRVAIVNETFARTVLHTTNAVGRRFQYSWRADSPPIEVVGVVADGKYVSLTEPPRPAVFDPILQSYNTTRTMVVRSAADPARMVAEIRDVFRGLDPRMPLYGTGGLEEMLGFALFPTRAAAVALGSFGLIAIVLAATGIHGLVAYAVARRRREIGIRLAIGATSGQVLALVVARIATLVGIGCAIGLVLAAAAGSVLSSVVYQVSPHDPVAFAGVAVILAVVALGASWAPARRSLKTDPSVALRAE
ncbi:MAG: ADOP family duplicated permease [Betaproteobacteria bacterium]